MIFVGIDGGGSKTKIRLTDETGKILSETVAGPANIRLSVDKSVESIENGFRVALSKAKILKNELRKYSFYAGLGLAGYELLSARKEFLKRTLPFEFMVLESDATMAVYGAHAGKYGSIVIAGTGVVGLKITATSKKQIGGWGFPHGDEGGGAWIGLEAVKHLLSMMDGLQKPTPLLLEMKRKLGSQRQSLTQWACAAAATEYASLTPLVVEFSQKQDPVAQEILKQAAKKIESILKIFILQNKNPYPCAFLGGLAPILFPYLKKEIRELVTPPKFDACHGAIFLVKKSFNLS